MTSPPTPADEQEIRALVAGVSAAWGAGDGAAFVAHYAADATAIVPGTALLGRDALATAMGAAFAGPLRGTRRVHEIRSVRFPAPGTAVLLTRSGTVPPGAATPPAWSLATWLLSRGSGVWLVDAYHECPANYTEES
jgi:uncharacterized protein (TIGR02246 family)